MPTRSEMEFPTIRWLMDYSGLRHDEFRAVLYYFFKHIIMNHDFRKNYIKEWNVAEGAEKVVFSAYIQAVKPSGK